MNAALWLLLWLRLKSWGRYIVRSLGTVKGVVLVLIGLVVFLPFVIQLFLPSGNAWPPDTIRRHGPGFLLLYCLINFFFSSGERGFTFSPAEVQFLFTGPFGRRQLLAYKVLMLFLIGLPAALLLSLVMRVHATSFLAAFVGVALMLLFMNLVTMALNLLTLSLNARMYTRLRRVLGLGLVVLAGAFLLIQGGSHWREWQAGDLLERLESSPVFQVATWPLRSFFELFLAERLWPDLVVWLLPALAVNGVLLVLVFWLDANFLESAAESSARVYARLQRLRSGNLLAGDGRGGKAGFTVPMLPWWGGVGPVFWRQLLTALRGLGRLTFVFIIFAVMLLGPLVATAGDKAGGSMVLGVVAVMTLWLTIMLTALVPFDFRGDVDRLATLKSLPIPAWRLTVGQLLTPSLMLSCLQWLVLACLLAIALVGGAGSGGAADRQGTVMLVLVAALFVFPFNFLLFGLENLLFLLFPVRILASTPGDFQAAGRNVLFLFGKILGLALVGGVAVLVGGVVFLVGRSAILAVVAAWGVVVCAGAALVPAVAVAFTHFDVGRDTPP